MQKSDCPSLWTSSSNRVIPLTPCGSGSRAEDCISQKEQKRNCSSYWSPNYQGLGKSKWNKLAKKVPLDSSQSSPCLTRLQPLQTGFQRCPLPYRFGWTPRLATHGQPFSVSLCIQLPKRLQCLPSDNAIRDIILHNFSLRYAQMFA